MKFHQMPDVFSQPVPVLSHDALESVAACNLALMALLLRARVSHWLLHFGWLGGVLSQLLFSMSKITFVLERTFPIHEILTQRHFEKLITLLC